jgi:5-methylcytosine-specific restriction endonuclease McrA
VRRKWKNQAKVTVILPSGARLEVSAKQYKEHGKVSLQDRLVQIAFLRSLPYQEYLQTPHWQLKRRKKLRLSGYRCERCAGKSELHVHHITYLNRGDERMKDLMVLCKKCHTLHHGL